MKEHAEFCMKHPEQFSRVAAAQDKVWKTVRGVELEQVSHDHVPPAFPIGADADYRIRVLNRMPLWSCRSTKSSLS